MKNKQIVKIALLQTRARANPKENIQQALENIKKASAKGAHIICLQELFLSLYFPQTEDDKHFKLAETIPGPSTEILSKAARENNISIIAPIFEKRTQGLYHNSAVIIGPDGKILDKYRKMHIPDDPGFHEKFYFSPGDLGFKVIQTPFVKIAVLICWDQWFPEAARIASLQGAQILFYPTAIGHDINEESSVVQQQHNAWQTIQRAHAIANGVFVAAVNRVGNEGSLNFWGSSFVADPFGKVVKEADNMNESLLVVTCDLDLIDKTRQGWPFLRDRRIDAYEALYNRFVDNKQES